jgi:hypothetical protein
VLIHVIITEPQHRYHPDVKLARKYHNRELLVWNFPSRTQQKGSTVGYSHTFMLIRGAQNSSFGNEPICHAWPSPFLHCSQNEFVQLTSWFVAFPFDFEPRECFEFRFRANSWSPTKERGDLKFRLLIGPPICDLCLDRGCSFWSRLSPTSVEAVGPFHV